MYLFLFYISKQIQELFIPIAAKQYYENPDLLVAIICVLWMVMCMSYFVSDKIHFYNEMRNLNFLFTDSTHTVH